MTIIKIVDLLFEIYWWLLIARFILSWVPDVDYRHSLVQFLHTVTDPVVRPFRGIIPPYGSVDFSPVIVFLALRLVRPLVITLLSRLLL